MYIHTHFGFQNFDVGGMLVEQLALYPHSKMFWVLSCGLSPICLEAGSPLVCVGSLCLLWFLGTIQTHAAQVDINV